MHTLFIGVSTYCSYAVVYMIIVSLSPDDHPVRSDKVAGIVNAVVITSYLKGMVPASCCITHKPTEGMSDTEWRTW